MRRSTRWDAEFTDFVAARSPQLYRNAYLLTTSPHAAEDLMQTALAKAYAAWWRVRGASDPVAYVHGILIKSFLSDRRRRSSGELPTDRVHEGQANDADPAQRLALMAALAELGDLDRAVVVLRYWEDRSVADTAAQLGLSVAAVRNRSLRALRSLRGLLAQDTLSAQMSTQTNGSGIMTNDERALRDVIDGSMTGVVAPTSRLSAGAVERGRRLRRRRRAATVVGAAALAAVVGVGIPQAIGSDAGDRSSGPGFAGSTGGTVQTEISPDPPPGWWSMPAGEMADHLEDMLPRGTRIVAMRTRSEEPGDDRREWRGFLVAHIDTPASSGPGGINLHVGPPETPAPGTGPTGPVSVGADAPIAGGSRQDLRCSSYGEELTSCQLLRDAEGRRIGRLSRLDLGDVVLLTATMRMTDGGTVTIDACNSTDDKWGFESATTADEPPLTLAQLRDIAADPVWTSYRP